MRYFNSFFREKMSPARSDANAAWLIDRNNDGSHDWRDLETMKERVYRLADRDGDDIVDDLEDCLQFWWIDLLIFARNVERGNTQTLQISFFEIWPLLQRLINNSNCYEKSLRPHFEFVVQFSKPIDQILAILVRNLTLKASI